MRDFALLLWLVAAGLVAIAHQWVPEATWLMIHLVALGALTHAVMVWSNHFSSALLRARHDDDTKRRDNRRLGVLGVGSAAVLTGVPLAQWWLVVVGAVLVTLAVVWHAAILIRDLRRALPGRFRICIRYYLAAACCLPIGALFGVLLAWGLDSHWHANLLVAHTMTMLLGWVGLTVVGTLVTFWPTVLRTRMDERAEVLAKRALPMLLGSLAVIIGGASFGWRPVAGVGIALYAVAIVYWGRSLVGPLRKSPPKEFAPASIAAAAVWAVVALVATAIHVLRADDVELAGRYPLIASIWIVGFGLQLLTGALSYLLPSVLGGGPRVVRAGARHFDRWTTTRLVVINAGLALWLLPLPGWVRVTLSSLVLLALLVFVPLMIKGIRASVVEKRRAAAGEPADAFERPNALTGSGVMAGVAALALAVSVGIGVDPGAAGLSSAPAASESAAAVAPSGATVRIPVRAVGMTFEPNRAEVNPGDHVIIVLTNDDATNVHDIAFGDLRTPRVGHGEIVELDLGVVGQSQQGWCTVVGHRQMGMTFDLVVRGSEAPTAEPTAPTTGHDHGSVTGDPSATLSTIVNPVAPALQETAVHRHEFRVTEEPLEVAPGLWQRRWTFNGGSVGPTLRGKVGDVFEITLINDGTMGHSIDFHAGAVAPDVPMRTIAPGESLVYTFTAQRAGIWMYHCSTMPMSAHIAAGMHGAVIIEPEDGLPTVDREYVLVQSEVFTDGATSAEAATDIDPAAVSAERPDKVVFNGIANQYDQQPFEAKVGERIRFWVLDAGPNRATSFHIVGGQFDTVYREGAYVLRDGVDAFGNAGNGGQALALQPAEGGFVELTFPEAGHYPAVSHIMVDAERGAHGIVKVTD